LNRNTRDRPEAIGNLSGQEYALNVDAVTMARQAEAGAITQIYHVSMADRTPDEKKILCG
jgi:hypothetical protein